MLRTAVHTIFQFDGFWEGMILWILLGFLTIFLIAHENPKQKQERLFIEERDDFFAEIDRLREGISYPLSRDID